MSAKTLVAGVGNIFLGDDGFGSEVARRLMGSGLPDEVRVADYGTSGMHLAYDLSSGYETAILIDASPRGEPPGTVSVLDVDAVPARGDDPPEPPAHSPTRREHASGAPRVAGEYARSARGDDLPEPAAQVPVEVSRLFDGHGMQPDVVLGMLGLLGGTARRILVVCCEPASVEYRIGLSEPVAAAVDEAVRIVTDLVCAQAGRPPAAAARADEE